MGANFPAPGFVSPGFSPEGQTRSASTSSYPTRQKLLRGIPLFIRSQPAVVLPLGMAGPDELPSNRLFWSHSLDRGSVSSSFFHDEALLRAVAIFRPVVLSPCCLRVPLGRSGSGVLLGTGGLGVRNRSVKCPGY